MDMLALHKRYTLAGEMCTATEKLGKRGIHLLGRCVPRQRNFAKEVYTCGGDVYRNRETWQKRYTLSGEVCTETERTDKRGIDAEIEIVFINVKRIKK